MTMVKSGHGEGQEVIIGNGQSCTREASIHVDDFD